MSLDWLRQQKNNINIFFNKQEIEYVLEDNFPQY